MLDINYVHTTKNSIRNYSCTLLYDAIKYLHMENTKLYAKNSTPRFSSSYSWH